jgi:hypothetical protein
MQNWCKKHLGKADITQNECRQAKKDHYMGPLP